MDTSIFCLASKKKSSKYYIFAHILYYIIIFGKRKQNGSLLPMCMAMFCISLSKSSMCSCNNSKCTSPFSSTPCASTKIQCIQHFSAGSSCISPISNSRIASRDSKRRHQDKFRIKFFVSCTILQTVLHLPSVTPVLSLQIFAIGLNFSRSSGGGHYQ